jgi:hypothetical protein
MGRVGSAILWLAKYAAGGIVSYGAPRLLVALGFPLDSRIVAMASWLSIHIDRETALWAATVLAGAFLYVGSVLLSKDHDWKPQVPPVLKRLWNTMGPWHLVTIGSGFVFVGLVMTVVGIVWQSPPRNPAQPNSGTANSASTPTSLLTSDGGPITWIPGQYIFGASGDDKGVRVQSFQATGKNNSDEFIQPLSGFLRSEVTGKQYPILVNDRGTLVEAAGFGIPAGYQFNIGVRLVDAASGGMTTAELVRDFGRMTFIFKYGDKTYTKHFTPEEIEAEVRRMERDLRPKPLNGFAGVRRISP